MDARYGDDTVAGGLEGLDMASDTTGDSSLE